MSSLTRFHSSSTVTHATLYWSFQSKHSGGSGDAQSGTDATELQAELSALKASQQEDVRMLNGRLEQLNEENKELRGTLAEKVQVCKAILKCVC